MSAPNPIQEWVDALEFLRNHDLPCPHCSYNLRGTATAKCPECGQDIDIVALAHDELSRPRGPVVSALLSIGPREWLLAANIAAWLAVRFLANAPADHSPRVFLILFILVGLLLWRSIEWWDGIPLSWGRIGEVLGSAARADRALPNLIEIIKHLVPALVGLLTFLHVLVSIRMVLG